MKIPSDKQKILFFLENGNKKSLQKQEVVIYVVKLCLNIRFKYDVDTFAPNFKRMQARYPPERDFFEKCNFKKKIIILYKLGQRYNKIQKNVNF